MSDLRKLLPGALLVVFPLIQGCLPAVIAGGAASAVSAHDRRSTGVQADDEIAEWKGSNRLQARYKDTAHVNFTAFNRVLLVSGEVPDDEARQAIGAIAGQIEGVVKVHNELVVGPPTTFSSRSNDAFVSSKYRARLLESKEISVNHVKALTENGTLFLMGVVTEREARAAIAIARTTDGVHKVVSLLEIARFD